MKKTFLSLLSLAVLLSLNFSVLAQEDSSATDTNTTQVEEPKEETPANEETQKVEDAEEESEDQGIEVIKKKFIEGGPGFMALPLICLILGLAIAIERLISLFLATQNKEKFVTQVEDALNSGGIEAAKDVCRNTRGPIASIFYQGLDRSDEGIEMVEKSVIAYGGVQMGQLERGLVWISLFIALAPMLGFMGTVIGMIGAFDDIQKAGDISPAIVASGIKVALLTTVAGLIVAIILQIFYNVLVSKIDSIVNKMEDASIDLVDMLVKSGKVK
jgi:biopolymer transport protein ExbB